MTSYTAGGANHHKGDNYNHYPRLLNINLVVLHYHQQSNQNPLSTNQYTPPHNNQYTPPHYNQYTPHNNQYIPPHIYQYAPRQNPPSTHIRSNRSHLVNNHMNRPHQYPPSNHVRSRNANIVLPHSSSRRKKSRVFCNSNKYQKTGKEIRKWILEKHRRNHNNIIGIKSTNNNTNGIMYDNINPFSNMIENKLVSYAHYVNNNNNYNDSINGHGFRELLDELQNKDNNNNNSINGHNKSLPFTFNNNESYVNNNIPLAALYNPNQLYIEQTVQHMDNAYKNMLYNINNNNINESHENINNCNRNETNTNMLYESSLILNENDNFRYKAIYKILLTTCAELPNTICKDIAEFSIGDILPCNNDKCDNEILIYGFSETDYFINNPNININYNPLIIDVNKQTVIFCSGCKNSIIQCKFKIEKKNEIYFDTLWCSNWFTWNGIHNTCSPCRQGKIVPINGVQVAVKVDNNTPIYSILTENKWNNNNYGGYHNNRYNR